VPASITADQLDPEARAELRTLPGDLAEAVARQLIAASLAEDPEQAYRHAQAARQLAARVGVVRESVGIAAYRAGHWAEALAELRAARRLTGRAAYLPMMADSERALGRLDRALDLVTGPQAEEADRATRIELKIVESGIRRDQGLPGAAVVALQIPELTDGRQRRGSARLYYAYADALLDAGRDDEAREWFARAAGADTQGETDADERFDELDQLAIEDLQDDDDDDEGDEDFDDDLEAEDTGDDGPGDEDGEARPGTAHSARDEPSPFEIHYLPPGDPGDPAADDGDPETAGDPGPGSPGADAADGEDGGRSTASQLNG
jgi:tetratricopeptide (TPR) repeat protein